MMKNNLIAAAELDRLDTWAKYTADMCHSCMSSCCTLPVEARIGDLIRIGVVDDFERGSGRSTFGCLGNLGRSTSGCFGRLGGSTLGNGGVFGCSIFG
jgi:hypothetical protein